jgi:hypothetical protein
MRPEVQVLPGPRFDAAKEVGVKKPLVLLAALVAAAAVAAKRRQAQTDAAALWREATSDASH